MSGAELAQAVRRAHPHIQIVLTSGYVREDEVPTGFPFIAKPWQPGDVKSAFEPALRS